MSAGLISCIMVTKPSRIGLAQRALLNFHEQTYEDKELVIVSPVRFDMPDEHAELVVAPNVKWVDAPKGASLSDLFTLGFEASTGAWVTFWDDDNLWHPRRLTRQVYVSEDSKKRPCFVQDNFLAFMDTKEIFVCLRRNVKAPIWERVNPYSLLVHRDHFLGIPPGGGGHPIVKSVKSYPIKGRVNPIMIPYEWKLGVIGVRGDNVRGYQAHRSLVAKDRVIMSVDWLMSMMEEIRCSIDQLSWWEPGLWYIAGLDGVAFTHEIINTCSEGLKPVGDPDDHVVRESQEV